ncbi:MAG: hypothetical protein O0V67_06785 [Methanocorpusculum sp.]|nr:hypothetical protein [Methanocorpusculum sp.]
MTQTHRFFSIRHRFSLGILLLICLLLLIQTTSAAEYTLNSKNAETFFDGISYNGDELLTLIIEEDVVITTNKNSGITSAVPVVIRSPSNAKLTIAVDSTEDALYGIRAPSVTVESGVLDISVTNGGGSQEGSAAYGICAESGNVTISGGEITIHVQTTCHKNKGIYAAQYISVTGGHIITTEYGGSNTFGLDGGDVLTGDSNGGIFITGGYISVTSGKAATRNYGIDSKYGTVKISGDAVVFICEDESGRADNFAYNENVTTISGGNAMVFTSEGNGNYLLRSSSELSQDAVLLAGKTFEIPVGLTLGLSNGVSLVQPFGTNLLFGGGYGIFTYAGSTSSGDGTTIYHGGMPAVPASPVPVAGILAGIGAVVMMMRRRE